MADIENLKKHGSVRKYGEDEYIFNEGDKGNELYIVLSGMIGIFINSFDGYPIRLSEMHPGDFFGEMSILEDMPRSASAISLTSSIVIGVNKSNFEAFICSQPAIAYKIMKALSSRIRKLNSELSKSVKGSKILDAAEKDNVNSPQNPASAQMPQDNQSTVILNSEKIIPPGHKSYSMTAPEAHSTYLFDKQVKCPVCDNSFSLKAQKLSKLKLDRIDPDFRKRHVDFEPIWYSIWACPKCYYSNHYFDFDKISDKSIKPLKEHLASIKGDIKFEFTVPRKIDQVFASIYIAISCLKVCNTSALQIGRLWMQLGWLYTDVKDTEMSDMAFLRAYENYFEAFYNSKHPLSADQEQQCSLMLGELLLKQDKDDEALKHFHLSVKRSGGMASLNQQAQDRIQFVKSKRKAMNPA